MGGKDVEDEEGESSQHKWVKTILGNTESFFKKV
jgi:hypothetical protein